jgi:hypothetical protein
MKSQANLLGRKFVRVLIMADTLFRATLKHHRRSSPPLVAEKKSAHLFPAANGARNPRH